jgi:ABC-2 type transport system ATP-binding protein
MTAPFIAAKSLGMRFDSKQVLKDINVAACPGDIVGVLGKNGAGKTTLLELLLGFGQPSEGHAELFGSNSLDLSDAGKGRIGYVPQRDELVEFLTGRQQLELIATFRDRWDQPLVDRLIGEWEIPLTTRVARMSVGERQKLSVVQTLAHHPDLLVLDEPVAALDPIARRRFLRQLLDIADMSHRTVVFSSHIVSDLERAAQQLWILREGGIVWQGHLDKLKERVVRIHVNAEHEIVTPEWPGILSARVNGRHAVFTVANFDDELESGFRSHFNETIEIETLGLEDIFVELHQ